MVDAHNKGGSHIVLGRRRYDHFLCACPDVRHGLFCGAESAGGVDDVLGSALSPWDQRGVALRVYRDLLSVYDDPVFIRIQGSLKAAEYGIISDHIYHIL